MTYRSRYLTTPMLPPVIDLLLLDETNPRSVAFQVAALTEHVDQLPRDADEDVRTPQQRLVLSLLTDVRLAEVARALRRGQRGPARRASNRCSIRSAPALPQLSELITRDYFSHAEARGPPTCDHAQSIRALRGQPPDDLPLLDPGVVLAPPDAPEPRAPAPHQTCHRTALIVAADAARSMPAASTTSATRSATSPCSTSTRS